MKRYLIFLSALFGLSVGCHAASPSFGSFNQTYFTTNNLFISIRTNWISTNSITTLIVTNLYVTNLYSTNIIVNGTNVATLGDLLWTNIGGILQPTVGSSVLTTNQTVKSSFTSAGSFHITGITSTNLIANTNQLNAYEVGTFLLTGPSTTASDTHLSLATGLGYQFLLMVNHANNSAFTFKNGQPLWDDPSDYVRLNGDWTPSTQGDAILLYHNGFWWGELGRINGNTNVVAPVVMNPTDTYLPVRQSAGVFVDSPLHIPSAGDTNVIANGALYVGQNSYSLFGDTDLALVQYRSVQNGDADLGGIAIYTQMTNGQAFASVDIAVRTNSAQIGTLWNDGVLSGRQITFLTDSTDTQFSMSDLNGVVRTLFQPSETSSTSASIANFVDTDNTWTQGYLFGVRNNGTNLISVGHLGQLTWGPGTTNVLYRDGAALTITNQAARLNIIGSTASGYISTGTGAFSLMSDGSSLLLGNATKSIGFSSEQVLPQSSDIELGGDGVPFAKVWSVALNLRGFNPGGGNYSGVNISHTGNAGDVAFTTDAAGTGTHRPYVFSIGSTNVAKFDNTSSAGQTRFWLYDEDNGTMERVTVGAADSGGVGFKLLRIPN